MREAITPAKPLKLGDKILVLASAWMFGGEDPIEKIAEMRKVISDMGFTPVVPDDIVPADGLPYNYDYAQAPQIRAEHYLQYLGQDSDIKAVWFAYGGIGTSETLDIIAKSAPKLLDRGIYALGFSDLTHAFLRLGQPGNGIMHPISPIHCDSLSFFTDTVNSSADGHKNVFNQIRDVLLGKLTKISHKITPINKAALETKSIEGQVWGGYFERVDHSIGTAYQAGKYCKTILMVEGAAPPDGEVDLRSVIRHLRHSGGLANISAIVVGQMTELSGRDKKPPEGFYKPSVRQYIQEIADENPDIAFFNGLNIGHCSHSTIMPLGTKAVIHVQGSEALLTASTVRLEEDYHVAKPEIQEGMQVKNTDDLIPHLEEYVDLSAIKLCPVSTGSKKRSRVLKDVEVIGGDAQEILFGLGTSNQILVQNKVLILNFNLNSPEYGANFERAVILRVLASLKVNGVLQEVSALIIGNVDFTPTNINKKSQRFIRELDSQLGIWLKDNELDELPVYTAQNLSELPSRFYTPKTTLQCKEYNIEALDLAGLPKRLSDAWSDRVRKSAGILGQYFEI